MNTHAMTQLAVRQLAREGERHRLEWGVSQHAARADIAFSSPTTLHLVEVKGPTDRLTRMFRVNSICRGQAEIYAAVASHCTLVCCPRLVKAAFERLPAWWGIYVGAPGATALETIRPSGTCDGADLLGLARVLHVVEQRRLLRGLPGLSKMRHWDMSRALIERHSAVDALRAVVYPVLFDRSVDVGGFREEAVAS